MTAPVLCTIAHSNHDIAAFIVRGRCRGARRKRGQAPSPETLLAGTLSSARRRQSRFATADVAL
jgi:hypothetical protein